VAKADAAILGALMDAEFWLQRWQKDELGFQLDEAHPLLRQFLPLIITQQTKVLVPLSGKSPDLRYLADFLPVIGVELSAIACRDFFAEHALHYELQQGQEFHCYRGDNITLWQGDFFALSPQQVQGCTFAYDRAALIALPAPMRQRYVDTLLQLLPGGSTILLISLEYPQQEKQGPPFSVSQQEIATLFPLARIEVLAEIDLTGKGFARRRFLTSSLVETAYRITLA
jgi:thiopurine S-methyltransferase